ncbi:hypothetical protein KJB99_10205 [Staphylococcus epidermidis]|uniref:hypothetical protein n=1 Tax=Staphylococcus epidermidis TaxID=1282 RepID=UPI001F47284E|nr:hypothetical protein [Staphylococcus epidermidis]MCE5030063.1 hypothetical protein [Staphylococcus epidermidis]MCE5032369.1 hypothetical protein [Staphylococcus epidermidis]
MGVNLNPNNVKQKKTETKQEEQPKQEVISNSDKLSVKDKIEEYSDERMTSGRINETHKRSTFLVDQDTLDKLQNLVDLMEGTNGLDSKYQDNLTTKQARDNRLLAKGFKSKIINYALDTVLEEWESTEGLIPNVEKVRYKTTEGTYNRAFKFEENGVLYYLEQNNRGHEVKYLATDSGITEDEINELFNEKLELAESQSNK